MPINSFVLNTKPVNGASGSSTGTYSGKVFSVQQKIMCKYVGSMFGVTQNVHFLQTQTLTTMVAIQQKVVCTASTYAPYKITQMIIS